MIALKGKEKASGQIVCSLCLVRRLSVSGRVPAHERLDNLIMWFVGDTSLGTSIMKAAYRCHNNGADIASFTWHTGIGGRRRLLFTGVWFAGSWILSDSIIFAVFDIALHGPGTENQPEFVLKYLCCQFGTWKTRSLTVVEGQVCSCEGWLSCGACSLQTGQVERHT